MQHFQTYFQPAFKLNLGVVESHNKDWNEQFLSLIFVFSRFLSWGYKNSEISKLGIYTETASHRKGQNDHYYQDILMPKYVIVLINSSDLWHS